MDTETLNWEVFCHIADPAFLFVVLALRLQVLIDSFLFFARGLY